MVGFSIVYDLGDEVSAHHDVDWLQVEMHYLIVCQISKPVNDIEQQIKLRLQGNCHVMFHYIEIEFLAIQVLHHKSVFCIEC